VSGHPVVGPSRGKKLLRWSLAAAALVFLGLQLVPLERSNPPVGSALQAPAEVMHILRDACYDCHSNETRWPWYSRVAPVSWWVVDHVEHARADLNFSDWPAFDFEAQEHAFEDIHEQIERREMPLRSYGWMHPRARLDDEERARLLRWAETGR